MNSYLNSRHTSSNDRFTPLIYHTQNFEFLTFLNKKSTKLPNNLPDFQEKHTKQKDFFKKTAKIHLKSYLTFLPHVFFFKFYMGFQKDRAKWKLAMVTHQRLTTTFFQITQPVAIQNTFVMLFFDNLGQWSKLDIKNQRENPIDMKFPTVNRKIMKKDFLGTHLFYQ